MKVGGVLFNAISPLLWTLWEFHTKSYVEIGLYSFPRAAVRKHCRMGALNQHKFFLSYHSGGEESEIKLAVEPSSLWGLYRIIFPCLFQLLLFAGKPWRSLSCRCTIPVTWSSSRGVLLFSLCVSVSMPKFPLW